MIIRKKNKYILKKKDFLLDFSKWNDERIKTYCLHQNLGTHINNEVRRKVVKLALLCSIILFIPYLMLSKRNDRRTYTTDLLENTTWTMLYRHVDLNMGSDILHNDTYDPSYHDTNNSISDEEMEGLNAANEYCNSPFKADSTHDEGIIMEGFKLRNVHVFLNHGDRTSNHRSDGYGSELFNCKFRTWYTGNDTKIQEFPDLMDKMAGKQGMGNHFLNWALFPDKNICANSLLTSRGALQLINLGQRFFESYSRYESGLNENVSLTSQIYAKSTSASHVYQSTVAFLFGFLPSFDISLIKIDNSDDLHFCTKEFSVQKSCYCKYANKLKSRAARIHPKLNGNNNIAKKHYAIISEMFGDRIIPSDTVIAEVIIPFFCHNITLPCHYSEFRNSCQKFIGDVWNTVIAQEKSKHIDNDQNYLKYSSIVMTPVLKEIINRIRNIIENDQGPKFILYSGQEATLSPLLHVLGLQEGHLPPYASSVVIELFENIEGTFKNRFYLRFLYNGIDKTGDVTFCKGFTYKGLCRLSYFTEFVFTKMIRRFGFNSYYDACSR